MRLPLPDFCALGSMDLYDLWRSFPPGKPTIHCANTFIVVRPIEQIWVCKILPAGIRDKGNNSFKAFLFTKINAVAFTEFFDRVCILRKHREQVLLGSRNKTIEFITKIILRERGY
jgi:hypothetical protein